MALGSGSNEDQTRAVVAFPQARRTNCKSRPDRNVGLIACVSATGSLSRVRFPQDAESTSPCVKLLKSRDPFSSFLFSNVFLSTRSVRLLALRPLSTKTRCMTDRSQMGIENVGHNERIDPPSNYGRAHVNIE